MNTTFKEVELILYKKEYEFLMTITADYIRDRVRNRLLSTIRELTLTMNIKDEYINKKFL